MSKKQNTRNDSLDADQKSRAKLPVTVAVPVKNEEANLSKCLKRLGRFPEIVVIDSDSTDRTVEIAHAFGARVVNFRWDGKFPKKRNWYLTNHPPEQPWVLFLDADEFVSDDFCDALDAALETGMHDGYWIDYRNYYLGRRMKYGIPQRKLALFRVGRGYYERIEEDFWSNLDMEIHEHPIIKGTLGSIHQPIDHRDYKGIGKFVEKHKDYALWEANRFLAIQGESDVWSRLTRRQRFKYRFIAKWWYPWLYFLATYVVKRGFLDGGVGFHYAFYKAWYFQTIRLLIIEATNEQQQ